jgi:uncharacterized protein YbjT (DUF2867 family)
MYVIMGGTGNIGSAVAEALLSRGEKVTIVTRRAGNAVKWRSKGAQVAEADVNDVPSLRAAFQRGLRAFLLNPPADAKLDTDVLERSTVANILAALEGPASCRRCFRPISCFRWSRRGTWAKLRHSA